MYLLYQIIEIVSTSKSCPKCLKFNILIGKYITIVPLYLHVTCANNLINKSVKINIDFSCSHMYLTFFAITAEYHIASNTTSVLVVSLSYVISNICA